MQRSLRAEAAGVRSLALAAVTSVAVSGALYALFHYVLLVPLPTGVWGYLNATTPRCAGFVRQRPGPFSRTTTPSSRAGRR